MSKDTRQGKVVGVNGNMISVEFDTSVVQNEVAYVVINADRLKAEVIRVKGKRAELQVFEDTINIRVGDVVEFTSDLLSVELGPGLLGQVFDGLQNPLERLAEKDGFFLKRGSYLQALDYEKLWKFVPAVNIGDKLRAGQKVGVVKENMFDHRIMISFAIQGQVEVVDIKKEGEYKIGDCVCKVKDESSKVIEVTMVQMWPIKVPITAYKQKLEPTVPLVSKIRIIDTLIPVAVGGTFCTPGPFGAGKTVLQHLLSRHAEVDIVIVAACGERAGEVVELIDEFPELIDPRTNKSLMERTIIICNTSSMPVAARESSVYTAVTLAEYYRQMGLNVLMLADSTSRWAQAMREMSGRLEEIPGEEAFPAYLESRIASFYERAGLVELRDGSKGSITIGGAVSPAGGNFEEPVTQATLKVVGAFHGLSRDRANARKYPSIDPLDSWSKYKSFIADDKVAIGTKMLKRSDEIDRMMKVIGEEGTSIDEFVEYLKGEFFDYVYVQQNAFDKIDEATDKERQIYVYDLVVDILQAKVTVGNKEDARKLFQKLRQYFINMNSAEFKSDDFNKIENDIKATLKQASGQVVDAAA